MSLSDIKKSVPKGVCVSPFALVRIASMPYHRLCDLTPPETAACIQKLQEVYAHMNQLRPGLEDVLYEWVPTIKDKPYRNAVIQLRRDIHNSRPTSLSAEKQDWILEHIDKTNRDPLLDWLQAQDRVKGYVEKLEAVYEKDIKTHLRPKLWEVLNDSLLSNAVALSSPHLMGVLAKNMHKQSEVLQATKSEKSLLSYFIRSSVKTTPFSTFMHNSFIKINKRGSQMLPTLRFESSNIERSVVLNRGLLASIYKAVVEQHDPLSAISFQPNTSLQHFGGGKMRAVTDQYIALNGRFWRQALVHSFRLHPLIAERMAALTGPLSWDTLWQMTRDIGLAEAQALTFLHKLLQRGLIWPSAMTDCFDPDPTSTLIKHLSKMKPDVAEGIVLMREAQNAIASGDWQVRKTMLGRIGKIEEKINAHTPFVGANAFRNTVFEESRIYGSSQESLGGILYKRLSELGNVLSKEVVWRPEYIRLRDAFTMHYGEDGVCTNLVDFIANVAFEIVPKVEYGTMLQSQERTAAPPGAKLGVTAFVQIVPNDAKQDHTQLVVNRTFVGLGWMSARFTKGDHKAQKSFQKKMHEWLVDVYAPREPVDLLISGECSDLQAHPMLTRRAFVWPGEPILPNRVEGIRAEDVTILHNPKTGLLDLSDKHGKPISLVYLGAALPVPSWGLQYALTVLARPFGKRRNQFVPELDKSEQVVFVPRKTQNNLVLNRATWWINTCYIRDILSSQKGFRRSLDIAEIFRQLGIPNPFFIKAFIAQASTQSVADQNARKPIWIDLRNSFCLDILEKLSEVQDEWLILTEMLPGSQQLWTEVDGTKHISELQVELLISAA